MGCGASAPKDAAASPAPKPAAAAAGDDAPYVPISEQPAVVALPDIVSKQPAESSLSGGLPDIAASSKKQQSALDAEMDAVLNATDTVALKEEQRRKAKEAFDRIDIDGSGRLEVKELHSVMQKLGLDISSEQFEAYSSVLMKQYDKDKSGTLEFKEFERFYGKCLASEEVRKRYAKSLAKAADGPAMKAAAAKAFAKYDTDASGTIEVSELRLLLTDLLRLELTDEQWAFFAEDTLKRGDKNGDRKFDFGEFLNLYKKTLADDKVRAKFEEKINLRYKDGEWKAE